MTPDTGSYGWSRCPSCGIRLDHVADGRPDCPSCTPPGLVGPLVDPFVPAEMADAQQVILEQQAEIDELRAAGLPADQRFPDGPPTEGPVV